MPQRLKQTAQNTKARQMRTLATVLAVALGVSIGAAQYIRLMSPHGHGVQAPKPPVAGQMMAPTLAGLTRTDGHVMAASDFKNPALIFFGFTHCPSFCPMALSTITDAIDKLPPEKRSKIDVYFVTLDPARDTPEALSDFVANFSPRITPLRGDDATIARITNGWGVVADKTPLEGSTDGDYTVDHTTYIYLTDAEFRVQRVFLDGDTAQTIAAALTGRMR